MKNKKFKRKDNPKKFKRFNYSKEEKLDKEIKISEINSDLSKETVVLTGVIERIVQTGGPTIFVISDGTGTFGLKGFQSPGERAYPELKEEDAIKAKIAIEEFKGELEGEIKKITKLSEGEHQKFLRDILDLQKKRAEIKPVDFLVKSKILEKLRDRFIKAAIEIRLAIIQGRPIIVRHHNDTDGYCAGYALEKAILPLITKEQSSEKAAWEFFLRAPCAAPFYEIDDSIRDAALSLRNVAKFSNKMPLVIIADNGSTPEDLLGIKHGKVHGMDFIVIDHHFSEADVISKEVLTHINPFLIGEDGSKFSAGMLCVELARMINPIETIKQIPATAGLADKIDLGDKKIVDDYLKIAKEDGYSKELLRDISSVIDFVSSKIRFMEVREYIGVLFGEPRAKQKQLVELLAPHIKNLKKKGLAISLANAKTENIGKVTFQTLDIENIFPGFGFFPKPGMCVGMLHDNKTDSDGIKCLITVGVMGTALTMRATDSANFSVHELIKFINKKSPNSFVEGGGHKNAGSITFLPNKQEEVLKLLKDFIKDR